MKHQTFTRLLSLLLTFALLLGCCPFAFAAEADAPSEPEIIAEQTEAPTESEAPGGVDLNPSETTSETEETEATEATEITEATEATKATEVTEAEELLGAAEAEPAELPYGLKGLPEGYALSQEQLDIKQDMIDHDVCATTEGLMPGKDYVENELVVLADTQEEAELYAAAFNAELAEYSYGVATLRLTGEVTVPQAVAASADMSLPLPAVSPNHIIRLNPVEVDPSGEPKDRVSASSVPQTMDWDSWVNGAMKNPDPYLKYPAASNYQYMHDMVDSYAAWGVSTGDSYVTVAVIDSGVYAGHADLSGKVTSVNVGIGTADQNGHGTHVAGIIAATMDNGRGGAGIAPNVKILNVRVLDEEGSGDSATIARGIQAAVDKRADVINMSLGGYFYNSSYAAAVKRAVDAGICVVAAMGNDGSNTMCYPAGYPGVIAVGAADRSGNRAYFSNWGPWLDVSAPGYRILSTSKEGVYDYEYMSGTSQATPVVSGVVALYQSCYRDTPARVEARLKATATKAGSNLGAGIVNAAKMLSEKPLTPGFYIEDSDKNRIDDTYRYSGKPVPCDSRLRFYQYNGDQNYYILYTLDGSAPAVKDGAVVNGIKYDWQGVGLSDYAGKTITVKAMQVNGLGMASKVLSKKVTVQKTSTVLGVTVNGPSKVIAGKSVQLTAEVRPVDKADQGVTWSIIEKSDNMAAATIDAKGKLTVPGLSAGQTGTVTVQAASKTAPEKKETREIQVVVAEPVTKITLAQTKLTLLAGHGQTLTATVTGPEGAELSWTSSNRKVATVDKDGVVQALSAGKATITCAALDGSGKSAKCTVTVTQPVTQIDITGQTSIAPGASATYKAAILPSKAGNKAVEWRLAEGAPSGITVSAKGAVKVEASVTAGTSFTLQAVAKDGSETIGQKTITVAAKCTTLTVAANDSAIGCAPGVTKNKSGVITAIGLFNVDLPNTDGSENRIDLSADTGSVAPTILWTSSNPAVVSVEQSENGVSIRAEKAGSAKITAAAQDGSGKKATVTVNVTVPASSIAIQGPTERMNSAKPYLACGKSAANKAVFADTYGKPTNQKVTWSYTARIADGSDVTAYVASQKWISVKNGKLSVSPKMSSYVVNTVKTELLVTVTATATDGTGVSGSITYSVVKPATKMTMLTRGRTVPSGGEYVARFSCDQWFPYNNPNYCDFIATSSNPEVASAEITGFTEDYYKGMPVYGVLFATGHKAGTAKITIKTVDGSNKSCSITVKVK